MKKIYFILSLLLFVTVQAIAQGNFSSNVASGNWNASGSWTLVSGSDADGVPDANDNVTILDGDVITMTADASCASLVVGGGTSGSLVLGNSAGDDLSVSGNITINAGGSITASDDGAVTVGGNLTNNGVFDLNVGGDDYTMTFNGTANQTLSGSGATNDFNGITVNNTGAANDNIVEITADNFTATAGFLTLTDGIFKMSGSFSFTNTFFSSASYNINAGCGLWINNPDVTVTGQNGGPGLDGILRISAGTFNLGTNTGNSLIMDNGSTFIMEGGAYNSTGRIQPQSAGDVYTVDISGGTITLATIINNTGSNSIFQITNTGCTFNMSGGSIIIQNSNTSNRDYENVAGTFTITGGTVQFGNASTPTSNDNFDIGASGVTATHIFPSIAIVDNGTSVPTVTQYSLSTMDVIGNITINAGTSLLANGRPISLTGNWTNDGTFTPGTQTTTFDGAAAQTIGGTTTTTFSSLTINNTAGGVSLAQDVNVSTTMTFTSGVVTSSSANILALNDEATVTGASNASYVDGPMTKIGNNDFTFPVGDPLGSYHRLRVDNSGGANGDSYTVEYFRASALTRGPVSSGIFGVSNCEHWEVLQNASGGNNPDISVSWTADSPCGGLYVTQLLGLTPVWFNGTNWVIPSGTGTDNTGNTTDGESQRDGASQFGYWALGNVAANGSPLPVKIGSIKAYEKMNGIQLDWTAFTEFNVEKYIIERSASGAQFTAIGDVAAVNSPNATTYGFFDASPLPGISYYRLRNLDMDGKSGYSNIVRVDLRKGNKEITLYPNPVRIGGMVSYSSANLQRGNYTTRIFNAAGQQVYVQLFSHNGGSINQTIQLPANVRTGYYTLQLELEGAKLAGKTFMVQ